MTPDQWTALAFLAITWVAAHIAAVVEPGGAR